MRVVIRGARELASRIADPGLLDALLRPGFEDAAIIVEGDAKTNAHRVTGKLQGSIGHYIEGHGASLAAHIGPQPGLGQPAAYTAAESSRWQKPRRGRNTGDPQVYARFEEEGTRYREAHPFLEPALMDNRDRVDEAIAVGIERVLEGLG